MELRDLLLALRRHWLVALIAFDISVGLGLAAAYLPAEVYASSATVFVEPGEAASVSQANFVVVGLVEEAQSRSLKLSVADEVAPEFRAERVKITATANGSIIRVRGEGNNTLAVADWTNAITAGLVDSRPSDSFIQLRLLDSALPSRKPVSPKPVPLLIASVLMGIIAAAFAAIIWSRARVSLDRVQDIRRRLGTGVLGEIPTIRELRKGRRTVIELLDEGDSDLVAAFQQLRTNMSLLPSADADKPIAIVSLTAGEGKSTVAAGIAWSLAATGTSVVLIDADLRRPRLHTVFSLPMDRGLADLTRLGPREVLQPTRRRNVSLIAAGLPQRSPADLIQDVLPRAIAEFGPTGERVIVDSPPIEGVAETPFVVGSVQRVILVMDSSTVKMQEISDAMERLSDTGAVTLGVVINRVRNRKSTSPYAKVAEHSSEPEKAKVTTGHPTRSV